MVVQCEGDGHYRAGRLSMDFFAGLRVRLDVRDCAVGEDGGVEFCGFFALSVEPEAGCELRERHGEVSL